jgi:hypothetical protein
MRKALLLFETVLMSATIWAQSPAPQEATGKKTLLVTSAHFCATFTEDGTPMDITSQRAPQSPITAEELSDWKITFGSIPGQKAPTYTGHSKPDDIFLFVKFGSDKDLWSNLAYLYYGDMFSIVSLNKHAPPKADFMIFVVPKAVSKTDTVFTLKELDKYEPLTFKVNAQEGVFLECQSNKEGFVFFNELIMEPNEPNP